MPTDAAVTLRAAIQPKKTESKDISTAFLLVPIAVCLFSILLAMENPAVASALALVGME
jgi:hypothetical protein